MTKITLTAALAAFIFIAAPATAQTLFSDNFNADVQGAPAASLINWNIVDGSVDVIPVGTQFDFYPGNGNYPDLDGSTGNAARIVTKSQFSLAPGSYQLLFDQGQNGTGTNTMTVAVGTVFSTPFSFSSATQTSTFIAPSFTFNVTSVTNAPIIFDHDGGDGAGIVIDNVRLVTVVPEVGTSFLLAVAGAMGMIVSRRKK